MGALTLKYLVSYGCPLAALYMCSCWTFFRACMSFGSFLKPEMNVRLFFHSVYISLSELSSSVMLCYSFQLCKWQGSSNYVIVNHSLSAQVEPGAPRMFTEVVTCWQCPDCPTTFMHVSVGYCVIVVSKHDTLTPVGNSLSAHRTRDTTI